MATDRNKYNKILKKLRVKTKGVLKPPEAILETLKNGKTIPVLTLGNFSLLIGKAKSKKSFLVGYLISIILSGNENLLNQFHSSLSKGKRKVLYFDTEQGKYHGQVALKRICRLINISNPKDLKMYCLRSLNPKQRARLIEHALFKNDDVAFVVIDGIKDLITSINSEEEATGIASKLLKWTEELNIHILCVLHQNKGDYNARGHIGSELVHKAETVLSVTKAENDKNISIVQPEMCRNEEPEPFAFEVIDGLPIQVENFEQRTSKKKKKYDVQDIPEYKMFQLLTTIFSKKDEYLYNDLLIALKIEHKRQLNRAVGDNAIRGLIKHMLYVRLITQEKEKMPYRLGEYKSKAE